MRPETWREIFIIYRPRTNHDLQNVTCTRLQIPHAPRLSLQPLGCEVGETLVRDGRAVEPPFVVDLVVVDV